MTSSALLVTLVAAPASGWEGIPGGSLSDGRPGVGALANIIDKTYQSLSDRVRPSGYAPTSVNGGYEGMFVRDSSIQAMAMQSAGETDKARSVLQYIASYGAVKGLERAPRYLPNEQFQIRAAVPVPSGNPDIPTLRYESTDTALFKLNAPSHGASQSFVATDNNISKAEFALLNLGPSEAKVAVSLRSAYSDDTSTVAESEASVAPSGSAPSWVSFSFPAAEHLVIGRTYYLVIQAAAAAAGDVQYWGSVGGSTASSSSLNFDSGWRSTQDRGAFRIFTPSGGSVEGAQSQLDFDGSAFRVSSGNRVAQPFTLTDSTLSSVALHAWADAGETGTARVSIRTSRDGGEVAYGILAGSALGTEPNAAWTSVPLTVTDKDCVTAGSTYYLHVESTNSSARIAVDGSSHVVAAPGAMWNYENSKWSESNKTLAFAINSDGQQAETAPKPSHIVARVGQADSLTQTLAVGSPLSGLDVYLAKGTGATGEIQVTIEDDASWSRTAVIAASDLTTSGAWHRVEFPTVGVRGNDHYKVTIAAPKSSAGSIEVFGVNQAGQGAAIELTLDAASTATTQDATIAFNALSLVYEGESMENQPDGNYMYLLAWARYIEAFPNDVAFRNETFPIVSSWADYYLTDEYWNDSINPKTDKPLNLLFNPLLEHSRKKVHFPAYDLITNVFASQALHDLAIVARDVPGKEAAAADWDGWSKKITQGIEDNLIVTRTVNGESKKIYRELYAVADGANPQKLGALSAYDGFTWVNLAPIAAGWYDLDLQIMANTYEAYLEEGSYTWQKPDGGAWQMLNACSSAGPDSGGTCNDAAEVIGKGLGWEFAMIKKIGGAVEQQRLPVVTDFVVAKTPSGLLQESFYPDGRPKDAGNQEQTSWWIWGALAAYPRASVTGATPTIEGIPALGQTLTADSGAWGPSGVNLAYQWYADGVAIPGATSSSLVIPAAAIGKRVSIRIVGSLAGHDHLIRESAATEPVGPTAVAGSIPTIAGTAQVGETLTAVAGTWTQGADLAFQWFADESPIAGATSSQLLLTANHTGKKIRVEVTGSKDGFTPLTLQSTQTPAVSAPPTTPSKEISGSIPTIAGTAQVGETLTAQTGKWAPTGITFTYQWYQDGHAVRGATRSSLVLAPGQVNKRISVTVTGVLAGARPVSRESSQTARVAKGKLTSRKVTIRGKARVGKKVKAVTRAWAPKPVKLTYRWYANKKRIKGATKKTLRIKAKQHGKKITVRVVGKKPGYADIVRVSAAKKARR
ncbi:hypothetical protein [Rarobacter incanus]|nr:hypothetical protein [Rarobacter incanus]